MNRKTYYRLFRALRGSRQAFARKFTGRATYPLPVLIGVCRKISKRTNTDVSQLIALNLWMNNNDNFDRSL